MRFSAFIEKHFWIVLIAGIVIALVKPLPGSVPPFIPKLLLGMMLFLVFLKIDAIDIIENIRNYKLMLYATAVYMFIIPLFFYFLVRMFDRELATGILLLTAMPAGVSTAALADIVKGNVPLSMSLAIVTQLVAPFSVPLLFWLVANNTLSINKMLLFRDIAILVFLPLLIAQVIKKYLPGSIKKTQHFFTAANVFLLFSFVYVALSSQRDIILENPAGLIWKIALLYVIFIVLHFAGYMICFRDSRENRISLAICAAYMNNGMAIVLAVSYFSPGILVLMVLSEIPWNTLLAPFKKVLERI